MSSCRRCDPKQIETGIVGTDIRQRAFREHSAAQQHSSHFVDLTVSIKIPFGVIDNKRVPKRRCGKVDSILEYLVVVSASVLRTARSKPCARRLGGWSAHCWIPYGRDLFASTDRENTRLIERTKGSSGLGECVHAADEL